VAGRCAHSGKHAALRQILLQALESGDADRLPGVMALDYRDQRRADIRIFPNLDVAEFLVADLPVIHRSVENPAFEILFEHGGRLGGAGTVFRQVSGASGKPVVADGQDFSIFVTQEIGVHLKDDFDPGLFHRGGEITECGDPLRPVAQHFECQAGRRFLIVREISQRIGSARETDGLEIHFLQKRDQRIPLGPRLVARLHSVGTAVKAADHIRREVKLIRFRDCFRWIHFQGKLFLHLLRVADGKTDSSDSAAKLLLAEIQKGAHAGGVVRRDPVGYPAFSSCRPECDQHALPDVVAGLYASFELQRCGERQQIPVAFPFNFQPDHSRSSALDRGKLSDVLQGAGSGVAEDSSVHVSVCRQIVSPAVRRIRRPLQECAYAAYQGADQ